MTPCGILPAIDATGDLLNATRIGLLGLGAYLPERVMTNVTSFGAGFHWGAVLIRF